MVHGSLDWFNGHECVELGLLLKRNVLSFWCTCRDAKATLRATGLKGPRHLVLSPTRSHMDPESGSMHLYLSSYENHKSTEAT